MKTGLLGQHLSHSYSPQIHRLLGDPSYELFPMEPEQVEDFVRKGIWDGLNVTIPYKKTAAELCQELTPLAKQLGSVNTLYRDDRGRLWGHNTDFGGFLHMTRHLSCSFAGKKALVLGSGGASVTVCAVLKELGCQVVIVSRQGEDNYTNLHRHADARFLVNATPVGMYPNNGQAPLSLREFPHLEGVLDLIYNPVRTALCLEAESLGIPFVSGLSMLTAQAAEARTCWDGTEYSQQDMETICRSIRQQQENLILVGMPGCGKTTVGQLLAQKLDRTFVDTDRLLTEELGSVPEYLTKYGEAAFRQKETQVLARVGKESGLVIATGGGVVTRPENYPLLHQNGRIIWLRRPLQQLSTQGRPLSAKNGVQALYQQREPLYRQFADDTADNVTSAEAAADAILEKWRQSL